MAATEAKVMGVKAFKELKSEQRSWIHDRVGLKLHVHISANQALDNLRCRPSVSLFRVINGPLTTH